MKTHPQPDCYSCRALNRARCAGLSGSALHVAASIFVGIIALAPSAPAQAVASVAAGGVSGHSMFVKTDGTLWAMGENDHGQLCDGTSTQRDAPVQVAVGVATVSTGGRHTMFVKTDGTLWAVGANYSGELGDGTTSERFVPAQVASSVTAVAAGANQSMILKPGGALWATGGNSRGQLGDGTKVDRKTPIQVASDVDLVSSGYEHTVFVKRDGTLWTMGDNYSGQLGDGTATDERSAPLQVASGVASVAAGGSHTMFVKKDGTLWGMGFNGEGALGDGTTTNRRIPVQVASEVVLVAAGSRHTMFVKKDGTLWTMGYNYSGQLGDGTNVGRTTPVQVASSVASVAAGYSHTLFVRKDGTLWAMGDNTYGQLGDGTRTNRTTPVQVPMTASSATAPIIVTQPSSQSTRLGTTATFTVVATGNPAPFYQWLKDGTAIFGAIKSTLTLNNALANAGSYSVVVSNFVGALTSSVASLTVTDQPTVSGVTVSKPAGTRSVSVTYTLSHPLSLPCTVIMQASRDDGATWEQVASATGAIGAGITSAPGGAAKSVTWNVEADWPVQLFPKVKIQITADDGQGNSTTPAGFALIPAGTFTMGDNLDGAIQERPTHSVTLSPFYMAKMETTNAEWEAVRDWGLSHGYSYKFQSAQGNVKQFPNYPVTSKTWNDVVVWLNMKSEKDGLEPVYYLDGALASVNRSFASVSNTTVKWAATGYRLPTEAEWEYAARGGLSGKRFPRGDTITHLEARYYSDKDFAGDVSETRGGHPVYGIAEPWTSPVGSFVANGYGLHDMDGNVSEWCWDWFGSYDSAAVTDPHGPNQGTSLPFPYQGFGRVNRGGRCAARRSTNPGSSPDFGFRQVRTAGAVGGVHSASSASFELNLTLSAAPTITTQPQNQTVAAGRAVTFTVATAGTSALTYQWRKDGVVLSGATSRILALSNVKSSDAGSYVLSVTNSAGTTTSRAANLAVYVPPAITIEPDNQMVFVGQDASFTVTATGTSVLTYQWRKDYVNLPGATNATLRLSNPQASDAGIYTVVIANPAGSASSFGFTLTIGVSRLVNLSVLTDLASGGDSFTLGYVVGGTGTTGSKPLIIRAAGPSLGALGVPGVIDDPKIQLFAGTTIAGENDNWGGSASIATAMAGVGAFAYAAANSKDAAIVTNVARGNNSVRVLAAGSGTGTVIAEIYDASPGASFTAATPRLVNVSVLKHIGSGLIAGFAIAGASPKSVLIRAVGPGLAALNVAGVLADPKLELFDSSSRSVATNDNWGGSATLSAAFTSVGAFALEPASKDAAILATLPPGAYTAQVSGVGGTTGVAIVEVYEVP